jgi:hypothetical protein
MKIAPCSVVSQQLMVAGALLFATGLALIPLVAALL